MYVAPGEETPELRHVSTLPAADDDGDRDVMCAVEQAVDYVLSSGVDVVAIEGGHTGWYTYFARHGQLPVFLRALRRKRNKFWINPT